MYLIGRIKYILDIQKFKNNFQKQSIVLITDEQYPQNIIIDFIQEKIDLLNFIKKNDKVKIFINIKGREWINQDGITKYFNSIQGWKIEKIKNDNYFEINSNYINNNKSDFDIESDNITDTVNDYNTESDVYEDEVEVEDKKKDKDKDKDKDKKEEDKNKEKDNFNEDDLPF